MGILKKFIMGAPFWRQLAPKVAKGSHSGTKTWVLAPKSAPPYNTSIRFTPVACTERQAAPKLCNNFDRSAPSTESCIEVAGRDGPVPAMGFYHYHISYEEDKRCWRPGEHRALPDFNPRGTGTQITVFLVPREGRTKIGSSNQRRPTQGREKRNPSTLMLWGRMTKINARCA